MTAQSLDYELAVAAVNVILDAAEALAEYDLGNADIAPALAHLMESDAFWTVLLAGNAVSLQSAGVWLPQTILQRMPLSSVTVQPIPE
jgi:hypothetical protein